ncbi:MAG: carbohydrate ABC transporter permease [Thermoflexales bacterium]|jgi:multiple sugar transport system permease protein|nr:carbohydrate ABC transporter permease [Thermoflexales bacterium]MBP8240994.1 carbohydrate ABC transporter permease [Thermoflexales bacterium]
MRRILTSHKAVQRLYDALAYVIIACLLVFVLGPLLWMGLTSLKREQDVVTSELQYIPRNPTLENYVTLWNRSGVTTMFRNSALTTGLTVSFCLLAGTFAAYSISRYRFRGRGGLLTFYLLVRMFPVVLMLLPLYIMLRSIGILDTLFGLALTYTTFLLPTSLLMLKGFFDAVPPDLEDAARIDGSTRMGALFRVVLPLARSGIAATGVLIAVSAWNEFLFALMLTNSESSRTWPVVLQLMVGEFQLPWGLLAAGGMISILPIIVFFAFAQRALVRGLLVGAVKG